MLKRSLRYGDWHICFLVKPIPTNDFDYEFYHDSYDGAPDANDTRFGHGASIEACIRQIHDLEEELENA